VSAILPWNGRIIKTGIFKERTNEKLDDKGVNITGDDHVDITFYGGINKAIYAYPMEHTLIGRVSIRIKICFLVCLERI
jgi:MOSC domain-containing protein YiiM